MTLRDLIKALEALPPEMEIERVGHLSSYRGYYDQLAIEPANDSRAVGDLLSECREAVGKVFTGYKGGEYRMTEYTPVWYSDYGDSSSVAVLGVAVVGERAVLHTHYIGDYA